MAFKELKITKCWPRTLRYIISPEMCSYFRRYNFDYASFTVGLTPFIINDPRSVGRHIEKVTD